MHLRDALESVRARLTVAVPGMASELFPDRPADYRLNHPAGAYLIAYGGSRLEQPALMDLVVQDRTIDINITIVQRQLNGNAGVLDSLDALVTALVGFRPPDCDKLWLKSDAFVGENGGLWQYAATFCARTVLVEDVADEPQTLLNEIILVEDDQ